MEKAYKQHFENFVEEVIKTYHIKGIGIVGFDSESILYEHYHGYRHEEKKLPIDRDSIFGIASISKSFTVLAILKMAEGGLIDINEKINTYFEDIRCPVEQMPTIKHLLSHAGGFLPQERFLMKDVAKKLGISTHIELSTDKTLADKGLDMIIERINSMEHFSGKPGERHSYSNFSYGLLTALVEKYGGYQHFTDYMMQEIIEPLGLKHTFYSFKQTLKEKNINRLYEEVLGHMNAIDDYEDMGFVLLGGGALKSTLNDMITYTRMYLREGATDEGQLLSREHIQEMMTPHVAYKPYEGYGYGLVTGHIKDIKYAGHSGGLTGVSSYFAFTPETGKGVVVLCNTSNVPASAIGLSALKLMNDQLPHWEQDTYDAIRWTDEMVNLTIGVYESEEGAHITLKARDGGIRWFSGNEELEVTIISENAVYVKNKMISSYAPILRDNHGKAWAIYSGSRIIKRKS